MTDGPVEVKGGHSWEPPNQHGNKTKARQQNQLSRQKNQSKATKPTGKGLSVTGEGKGEVASVAPIIIIEGSIPDDDDDDIMIK